MTKREKVTSPRNDVEEGSGLPQQVTPLEARHLVHCPLDHQSRSTRLVGGTRKWMVGRVRYSSTPPQYYRPRARRLPTIKSITLYSTTPTHHTALHTLSIHHGVLDPVLDNPSRSTDGEPISSTGSALTKIASLKKEREKLWTLLEWARVRGRSGRVGSIARRLRQVGWSARRLRH